METSMAVPFNPEPLGCVTGRCKYWADMAEYMDQVFVMGYDSQDNVLVGEYRMDFQRKFFQKYFRILNPSSGLIFHRIRARLLYTVYNSTDCIQFLIDHFINSIY